MIFVIQSSSGCLLTLPLTFQGEDDVWIAEIDLLLGDFRDLSYEEQAFLQRALLRGRVLVLKTAENEFCLCDDALQSW